MGWPAKEVNSGITTYSCLFQVRNNEKIIIFKQNLAKKFLVLNIKNINIITSHTHKTKINENAYLVYNKNKGNELLQ